MVYADRTAASAFARPLLVVLFVCLALLAPDLIQAQAGGITYVYDELGRLVGVIDPAGDTVRYTYDASGNLLTTTRASSSLVSVIEFTPNSGPVGATVTIYGTGFSATPSQNTVTFNGTSATVTSASATRLVTTVPTGATTGTISVTTPSGSATSATSFNVSASGAPSITSFTPTSGTAGTAVTITGTNFETTAANNRLKFNLGAPDITSATSTSIATSVPLLTGSGRITVATPAGTAASSADFFIPPSPYTPADLAVTGRMAIGESRALTVSTANKIGLVVFDATAGQRVCLKITGVTLSGGSSVEVKIRATDGSVLASAVSGTGGEFIDAVTLPKAGTYTIQVDHTGSATGSLTLNLYNVAPDVTGPITAGGSAVTATTTTPGQNVRLTFSGSAGQRVSLKTTSVSMTGGTNNWVNVSIRKPDNTSLASDTYSSGGGFIDVQTLPTAGTYTVLADPTNTSTGSVTLTLYDVPADITGPITAGGSAVTATTTTPGQNAKLTFTGTAGQRVSLKITGVSLTGGSQNWVVVTIKKPDNTNLASDTFDASGGFIDVQTLPTAGTYTVLLDPYTTSAGSVTATLYDVPADVTGPITAGGSAATVTTTTPGQNGGLTFSGTSGQRVSLRITGVNLTGNTWVTVAIKKPDGTTLDSNVFDSSGGFIDTKTLSATGTYTVFVDPYKTNTGSVTATLYDVPADDAASTTVNGTAASVSTNTPGQNASVTFGGTSGQQVTVHVTNNTMGAVTVKLLKPDGTQLTSSVSSGASFNLSSQTLNVTGTFKVSIDPSGINTGSMTVSVTNP